MHEKIEDVDRTNQLAGEKHAQLFDQMRLRPEGGEAEEDGTDQERQVGNISEEFHVVTFLAKKRSS